METTELLKKVRTIELKTRGLSKHIFAGHYHSAFKGKGMSFSEVREYQYGDDIRSIDWNVTARFNHPYVKVFEEERELTVILLVDVSGSRDFGSQEKLKKNLITELSAVVSFSAIQNNDKIGVIFFSDKVEKFIPPQKGRQHTLRIIRELIDFKPGSQQTNITEALRFLTNAIKKRSICFLISDLMDSNYESALKVASRKHDLIAVHTYDKNEYELPPVGLMQVKDAETGSKIWIDASSKKVRNQYKQWWEAQMNEKSDWMTRNGIDMVSIETSEDYVKPLLKLFKKR